MPLFQPILHVIGLLMVSVATLMLLPAIVDLSVGNPDWQVFAVCAMGSGIAGLLLSIATRQSEPVRFTLRQGFLITGLAWLVFAGVSALPFLGLGVGYSDAFFEAVSGATTTGATVLTGLDRLAPGILFWRALLQWIGGIGIIVMAIIILPYLRVGGMQLFRIESSDTSTKVVARSLSLIAHIAAIYVGLTVACAIAYGLAGMSAFDAVCHAMTTLSTGGYANYDASFGQFGAAIHWIASLFMIAGALPFTVYVLMVRGQVASFWANAQVRGLLWLLGLVSVCLGLSLSYNSGIGVLDGLRLALFHVVSIVTTTGYATTDFQLWGPAAPGLFFVLMFVGGCAGSTSGSIKIYRHQIVWMIVSDYLKRLVSPNRITSMRYDGKRLGADIPGAVLAFVSVYFATIMAFSLALTALGLDLVTALSGAATAISNVGPGLGDVIGPAGNFAPLPDAAKWILSFAMLMGRLELFALLVMLNPDFWR